MATPEGFINRLCAVLVRQEVISVKRAKELRDLFADASHERFTQFLVEENFVSRSALLQALSQLYQVPLFDVKGYFFDTFLVQKFPKGFLLRNEIIPLNVDENMLIVVAEDPENEELLSGIGKFVSYGIRFYVGIAHDIRDAVKEFYDESLTEIKEDLGEPL
jgi:hypothetical protein